MTDFKLSCCRLFERFPLYNYRMPDEDDKESRVQKLGVLLIGYGSRMDTIFGEVLTNGQLLDTELEVTAAGTNARNTCESLRKKAPYLEHFVRITVDGSVISEPEEADRLATIHFVSTQLTPEAMPEFLLEHCSCSYLVISTGNDEKNYALAEACAGFIADHSTLIAYVQKRESDEIEVMSPLTEMYSFGSQKEAEYKKQIEKIALNLHFSYAKSQNEHAGTEQILEEFRQPYNYVSNIESAVHIRSKLACCGITDESTADAAEKFSALISADPSVVDRLSVLEHRRWMMEKLLQGYRQVEDLDLIYGQRGVTTHSSGDKWHTCLVSCDPEGKSHILPQDWKFEGSVSELTHLDALDQISIRLHRKCGQLARTNRPRVLDLMKTIRGALTGHNAFSEGTLDTDTRMEMAISQMYQQKRSAVPLYERAWRALKEAVASEGKLQAFVLNESLDLLDSAVAPLKEFISCKDYKYTDRVFIKRIPFVLSHKISPKLVKLLANENADNLFSVWQLEPESVSFVGFASDSIELMQLRQQANNICGFVSDAGLSPKMDWHILVPEKLADAKKTSRELFKGWKCTLHVVRGSAVLNMEALTEVMEGLFDEISADYLDVTGTDRLFSRAAELCAERHELPAFYIKNGNIFNLFNAPELEYDAPGKGLTVAEMFSLSGAVVEENEGEKLSDLSQSYSAFWKIARDASGWDTFCKFVTAAYNNTDKPHKAFILLNPEDKPVKKSISVRYDVATALIPVLKRLSDCGFIREISIALDGDDQRSISFKAPGAGLAASLRGGLLELCEQYTSSTYFTVKRTGNRVLVMLCDFSVKEMELPEKNKNEYRTMLINLESARIIQNLAMNVSGKYSFMFSSRDVLNAFQLSGRVLEYFLYYSALLEGHFTDVSMGWKFLHSSAENSAENELDVICTRGTSSLFISAKMVSASVLKTNNKLNYIFYEVSLLADRFGVNAKPVLAAPQLPQFAEDEQGNRTFSSDVLNALKRGVYLLGTECFRDEAALGRVLDNIMDGREDWCDFL